VQQIAADGPRAILMAVTCAAPKPTRRGLIQGFEQVRAENPGDVPASSSPIDYDSLRFVEPPIIGKNGVIWPKERGICDASSFVHWPWRQHRWVPALR